MSEGQPILLARYLADVAQAVEGVATYLANQNASSSVSKAGEIGVIEWEGTLTDFQDALAHEQHEPVAIYLNDASKVIRQVATALQEPSRKWHLQFTRKGSGRRSDPLERLAQQLRKDRIRADMRRAVDKYGKQEAAISEVGKKWKLSRAQLLRLYKKTVP